MCLIGIKDTLDNKTIIDCTWLTILHPRKFGFFLDISYWFSCNCVNLSILISLKNHGLYIPQKHITQSAPATRDEKWRDCINGTASCTFISLVTNKKIMLLLLNLSKNTDYRVRYISIHHNYSCLVF